MVILLRNSRIFVQSLIFGRFFIFVLVREIRILVILLQRGLLDRLAIIHAEVALRHCQAPVLFRSAHFSASAEIWR